MDEEQLLGCFSRVQLIETPWTAAGKFPLSMEFSRQEYWSGLPFPSLGDLLYSGIKPMSLQFSSVQLLSRVQLFVIPWIAALQASLSITNSQSLVKLMSIKSVMPSNRLILCCPLLLLPSIFPSIWVFSNKSVLHISWPKYWSFSFSISHSNEYSGLISLRLIGLSNPTSGHTHRGNQIWKRHVYSNVHHSTVYNCQDMEAT